MRIEILTRDYNSLKELLALPDPSIELPAKFSLKGTQLEFGDDIIADGLLELLGGIYDKRYQSLTLEQAVTSSVSSTPQPNQNRPFYRRANGPTSPANFWTNCEGQLANAVPTQVSTMPEWMSNPGLIIAGVVALAAAAYYAYSSPTEVASTLASSSI